MGRFNFLYIIVIFALLLVLQNIFILRAVNEMSGDARVVNYSGLVRGATQRLVKLELSHRPNDQLLARLEEYLYGLSGEENSYDIAYMVYEPFQTSIAELLLIWEDLKSAIYGYRDGTTTADFLLEVSERHFQKADEATSNAEYGSDGKLVNTELLVTAGIIAIIVIVLIVILALYILRRAERHQVQQIREKNEQLEAAILQATEANKAKSLFLSNMSHDIRTPLNGIIGMTAIAAGRLQEPERIQDCLRKIEHSSRHLQSLVNDVLDMSKIESGKLFLTPVEIYLPEFTQSLINIVQQQIKDKQQFLKVSAFSVLHEHILGDQLRLNQIFVNILSNAIKFTPVGGTISLVITEQACEREDFACFTFICSDTGIGMGADFKEHVFESFAREEDSRIDKIEGSGLGLSITKRIVDMMGGDIHVQSEKNKGTSFTITLEFPLNKIPAVLWETNTLKDIRVLVIEGDDLVCASLANEMSSLGIIASVENTPEKGLALLTEGHVFDAVILDWDTPEWSHSDILEQIRQSSAPLQSAIPPKNSIPIIISSVYDRIDLERETAIDGVKGFITKPLFKSVIYHTLREILFVKNSTSDAFPTGTELRLDGIRILMAEDNALNTEIACEILTMDGIILDCAVNGQEAVALFNSSPPFTYGAILMDMQMPIMTGCEATEAIRRLPREDASSIPIIAMTANAFDEDIREALDSGMNEHVAKPVDFDLLIRVLHKCITQQEAV
ncbi:MAG: response regulator [Spirochaetaceae bacterium]|jgi:signal transduction histidine kinase/CheY-like chemotaxis protein|nr:response regulator [Spirochaetaceae bacterium]